MFGKDSWFRSMIHNCIVHPLLMFLPVRLSTRLHDKNANWAYKVVFDELKLEGIKKD